MKYLLILLSTLLFFSCGASKKVKKDVRSNQTVVVTDTTLTHTNIVTQEGIESIIQEVKAEDEQITIQVTTYDTTKPVDTVTKKPPVASEMVIVSTKKIAEKKESTTSNKNEQTVFQNEQTGFRSESTQDSTSIVIEEPVLEKSNKALKFVRIILGCLIVVLLIYYRKPIMGLFSLFKSH